MPGSKRSRRYALVTVVALGITACTAEPSPSETTTETPTSTSTMSRGSSTATSPTVSTSGVPDVSDLLVLGDWGSGNRNQDAVAEAMREYAASNEIAAILTTGDNLYHDEAEELMAPLQWAVESDIQMWIAWGNHDVEDEERIRIVNETFDSPPHWAKHEWGEVDVLILDSNQVDSADQMKFLAESLEESDRPTIVVMHHPAYSCSRHGSTKRVVREWVPVLDEDVFLVLAGHDHNYQRFEHDNATYVVTGGGGRSLYELETCPGGHPERLAGAAQHNFVALRQTPGSIEVTALGIDLESIDQVDIAFP